MQLLREGSQTLRERITWDHRRLHRDVNLEEFVALIRRETGPRRAETVPPHGPR